MDTLASIGGAAFLFGPVALLLLGAHAWITGQAQWARLVPTAVLLSLLSVAVAGTAGGARIIQTFVTVAETGRGGTIATVVPLELAARQLLYGVLAVGASLVIVAASVVFRRGDPPDRRAVGAAPMGRAMAVGCSVVLLLAVVGADYLLRLFHQGVELSLPFIDPSRLGEASSTAPRAAVLAENYVRLLVIGGLLTVLLGGGGVLLWRVSRRGPVNGLLTWTAAAALALILIGGGRHAGRLADEGASLRELIDQATARQARVEATRASGLSCPWRRNT